MLPAGLAFGCDPRACLRRGYFRQEEKHGIDFVAGNAHLDTTIILAA
jgi:hypothetical protein